jgi:hypothetical protein
MVDKLIEDIVEVTETLMEADEVDIQALAQAQNKPTLNERTGENKADFDGYAKWGKHKAHKHRQKMKEQQSTGVFKRGTC